MVHHVRQNVQHNRYKDVIGTNSFLEINCSRHFTRGLQNHISPRFLSRFFSIVPQNPAQTGSKRLLCIDEMLTYCLTFIYRFIFIYRVLYTQTICHIFALFFMEQSLFCLSGKLHTLLQWRNIYSIQCSLFMYLNVQSIKQLQSISGSVASKLLFQFIGS